MIARLHLGAVCAALLLVVAPASAAETHKDQPVAASPGRSTVITEGPTHEMQKFVVNASRLREIDSTIKHLEKLITRENKLIEKSAVDDTLNSEKVSRGAALFGGKSSLQRASVAAVRVASMEKEIALLEGLRDPLTAEDRALMEKLIQDQRTYRRDLDITLR